MVILLENDLAAVTDDTISRRIIRPEAGESFKMPNSQSWYPSESQNK